ncbi:iron complex transport system permease protein [Pedobacter cryoconitis]|uniref:FecCD family ABC transporter permease n=1 Tax=Pedobacter cryoconitis TaxID=188932 RepID=UPI00161E5115|nr:iron ABC transporter permease [Pedobacter cryoconitis]MBB6273313.1 iron complex transport system permease protein [Pedobacter cryoconitis]
MKPIFVYCLLIAALMAALSFSLGLGAMDIPVKDVLLILFHKTGLFKHHMVPEQYETVIRIVRLPRVLLGVLVGAGLGISGAAVQGIFRNPLAEPGLIGISAGASLIAVAIIALEIGVLSGLGNLLGYYLLAFGAFAGAGIAAMLVYQISRTDGRPNVATMLLAGIAINALAGALTGLITYLANEQQLRNITFWMLGSLAGATWETVLALLPFIVIPVVLLPFMGKALNAFALGEAQADHLGLKVNLVKRRVVILATMAVGAAVAVSGVIGFVGLLVPHTIRLFIGVDNKYVLPASALLGALILTLADMIARTVVSPVELPIGVITALLGTPLFLYILIKDKKKLLQ